MDRILLYVNFAHGNHNFNLPFVADLILYTNLTSASHSTEKDNWIGTWSRSGIDTVGGSTISFFENTIPYSWLNDSPVIYVCGSLVGEGGEILAWLPEGSGTNITSYLGFDIFSFFLIRLFLDSLCFQL